jgi:uncharacterized protein (TIGR04255 family)
MATERVRFSSPPVAEVACGIVFPSLPGFKTAHVGLFWNRVRSTYPRLEEAPPVDFKPESKDPNTKKIQVQLSALPPMRRSWFLTDDGSHLIQLQHDRFLFNWKRVADNAAFPSYDAVIEKFDGYLKEFTGFLKDEKIGELSYRQLELTYVNLIGARNGLDDAGNLFVDHLRQPGTRFLPQPETFNWNTSYALPNDAGRLHVTAQTAIRRETKARVIRLQLSARGVPYAPSESNRRPWFDLAHEWITRGFADFTSDRLHKEWGRTS